LRAVHGLGYSPVVDPGTAARFQLLHELGLAFAARIEIEELVALVVEKCRSVFAADGASVILYDAVRDELYFPYVVAEDPRVASRLGRLRLPAHQGIAGAVFDAGKPEWIPAVSADPRFCQDVDRTTGATTRALLCAPLASHQGRLGVLQVVNPRSGTSAEHDLTFLEALAGSVAVALENARLYAALKASEERLRTEVGVLRRDLARQGSFAEIVGRSPVMTDVFRLMESAAASPVTVLIEGETGTGKELVARALHRAGARATEPFVAINCAALPESLLESELFGHRKGAFTGAIQDRRGLFEAADGGTIFLDEVGEMPLAMQAKLLRVLQEGEVTPIGDHRPRRVDVRVIAATNRDLVDAIQRHAFRQDLYYRLAIFPIVLPPLRARRDDVPLLVDSFVAAASQRHGKRIGGVEPSALERLVRFPWPGNVRELQNEIERAVALSADGAPITMAALSAKVTDAPASVSTPTSAPTDGILDACSGRGLREARAAFEIRYIAQVLRSQGNNVTRAARALGLSRVMLQKKMKEYGLREPGR
jgi:Nif-specific regulatory protein